MRNACIPQAEAVSYAVQEGIKEGKQQEKLSIIRRMLRENMEGALIRRITGCTDEEMELAVAGR